MVDFGTDSYGSFLLCAYIGFYSCCTGDTWSSECGVLRLVCIHSYPLLSCRIAM